MPVEAKESTTAIRRAVSRADQCAEGAVGHRRQVGPHVRRFRSQRSRARRRRACPARRSSRAPSRRARPQPPAAAPAAAARRRGGTALRGTLDLERPAERPSASATATATYAAEAAGCAICCAAPRARKTPERRAGGSRARPAAAQRSPLHVVESLNSLSVDIARAIDHEASIELWNRYRRGERDVFTRRLYTLKGQQTFDEIRRKYQSDAEFRAAVDRYCDDFEKLLKDIAAQRPRQHHDADLPDVGHRQGLHHAGACQRPAALRSDPCGRPPVFRSGHGNACSLEAPMVVTALPPLSSTG